MSPRENRTMPAPASPMRIKRRGKILYSLIALMLLAGLVPLVLTTAWIMSSSRDALESSERLLQIDQTRSIAQQSRLYLQSMHNQIAAIAETFEIASNLRAVSQRIASVNSESLLDFVEEDRVLSISVFDPNLNGVFAGYTLDDPTIDSSIRQSLVEALQGRTWVSPPHIFEPLLDTVVIMSSPVRAPSAGEGEPPVVGVVSATISLKPIYEIVSQKGNDRRSVYVVDSAGKLVTHWDAATLFEDGDRARLSRVPRPCERLRELRALPRRRISRHARHLYTDWRSQLHDPVSAGPWLGRHRSNGRRSGFFER